MALRLRDQGFQHVLGSLVEKNPGTSERPDGPTKTAEAQPDTKGFRVWRIGFGACFRAEVFFGFKMETMTNTAVNAL